MPLIANTRNAKVITDGKKLKSMLIRSLTVVAFLMMTLSSSMVMHACAGEHSGMIAGIGMATPSEVGAADMSVSDSMNIDHDKDCSDLLIGQERDTCCDDCAMTCVSNGSLFQPPVLFLPASVDHNSVINLSLSTRILSAHKFRFLRPPIA
jgi:hypothetical protein